MLVIAAIAETKTDSHSQTLGIDMLLTLPCEVLRLIYTVLS